MDTGDEPDDKNERGSDQDDGQQYIDRSKIDFDPDDGLYTGTAVEGTSEIPGPHEHDDAGDSGGDSTSEPKSDKS
jgi:hypothetical protein